MLKKFFKKIGKKIKKLGKSLAKPFKKIFKNKFLGTIGMMLIAPMLMQGMGTFFRGVFNGQGMGQSFTKAVSKMGETRGGKLFNNISDGIKDMFGGENVTKKAAEAGSKAVEAGSKAVTEVDFISDSAVSGGKAPQIIETEIAKKPPVDTSTVVTDATGETFVKEVSQTGTEKVANILDKTTGQEWKEGTLTDDFFDPETLKTERTVRSGKNLVDRVVREATDQTTFTDKVADFWHGDTKYADFKEKTFNIQPLKNVEALPGFVKNTTVGEAKLLADHIAMNKMPEPYQAPSVDVSGAFEALSQVDTSGIGLETIGTNVPSMSALAANGMNASLADKWMNMTKKYNYIYDTSFPTLAT